jgi:hypothetical protein
MIAMFCQTLADIQQRLRRLVLRKITPCSLVVVLGGRISFHLSRETPHCRFDRQHVTAGHEPNPDVEPIAVDADNRQRFADFAAEDCAAVSHDGNVRPNREHALADEAFVGQRISSQELQQSCCNQNCRCAAKLFGEHRTPFCAERHRLDEPSDLTVSLPWPDGQSHFS